MKLGIPNLLVDWNMLMTNERKKEERKTQMRL